MCRYWGPVRLVWSWLEKTITHLLFHRAQQLADFALDAAQATVAGPFPGLKRTEFDQPDRRRELRLVQRRLQPADGVGLAQRHRQAENLSGEILDPRNPRAATAQENSGPQVIEQTGLADFLGYEVKNLLDAESHDATEMFEIDGAFDQAMTVGEGDGLA